MDVNRVTKKLRLPVEDSVRFQLITALVFTRKESITPTELDILIHLTLAGEAELGKFCNETVKKMYVIERMEDFSVKAQNIRNIITKLCKRNIVEKSAGKGKKTIKLHPTIEVFYQGNVLLDYQFLTTEV